MKTEEGKQEAKELREQMKERTLKNDKKEYKTRGIQTDDIPELAPLPEPLREYRTRYLHDRLSDDDLPPPPRAEPPPIKRKRSKNRIQRLLQSSVILNDRPMKKSKRPPPPPPLRSPSPPPPHLNQEDNVIKVY